MLTRWTDLDSTFSVFNQLHRRMNQIFNDYEPETWTNSSSPSYSWPAVNLYDAGEELFIYAQVPGLSEKEINLSLNQEVLTITGERIIDAPEGYSTHRQERGAINFSRSFTFPCKIDPEKVTASVKNGLLTIKLAKAPEAKPRQISVQAQ